MLYYHYTWRHLRYPYLILLNHDALYKTNVSTTRLQTKQLPQVTQ